MVPSDLYIQQVQTSLSGHRQLLWRNAASSAKSGSVSPALQHCQYQLFFLLSCMSQ